MRTPIEDMMFVMQAYADWRSNRSFAEFICQIESLVESGEISELVLEAINVLRAERKKPVPSAPSFANDGCGRGLSSVSGYRGC